MHGNGIGVAANRQVVGRLLKHGVRVFVYPGMTHVKTAIYDNWASFGSANFDDLSLHKNYELNLFTNDSDIVRQIREDLLKVGQERSVEIFHGERAQWLDHFRARITQYL